MNFTWTLTFMHHIIDYTVKPVCNDHLYNKIYYLCLIQLCVLMKTEGTNYIME